jgi:hypothetical protein
MLGSDSTLSHHNNMALAISLRRSDLVVAGMKHCE